MVEKVYSSTVHPTVISCSRRTDFANYMDKIVTALHTGGIEVPNPRNRKMSYVAFDKTQVWAWWSKDYLPWLTSYLAYPMLFEKYPVHLFNYTITGLDNDMENIVVPLEGRFLQLEALKELGTVVVRYDPIVKCLVNRRNELPFLRTNQDFHEELFHRMAQVGVQNVVFSFCTYYPSVKRRMIKQGFTPLEYSASEKQCVVKKLIQCAKHYDIRLRVCCNPDIVEMGVKSSSCIDGELINQMLLKKQLPELKITKDHGQREHCGCISSRDIGSYDWKCKHNCVYCYANPDTSVGRVNLQEELF